MAATKRFSRFTLRRTPFWLFFLAGISALTLAPLFIEPLSVSVVAGLAIVTILASLTARFRDIGCSAWYVPLAAIPLIAFYAGITASDDQLGHPGAIENSLLGTSLASFTMLASWAAYLVVKL